MISASVFSVISNLAETIGNFFSFIYDFITNMFSGLITFFSLLISSNAIFNAIISFMPSIIIASVVSVSVICMVKLVASIL